METIDLNTMKPNERLKHSRLTKELTQVKLGELTGITQPNIASYETGKRTLGLNAAKRLAKVLGINYKDLI
jgi:transcriptional regulator with XRE-family HTH domain